MILILCNILWSVSMASVRALTDLVVQHVRRRLDERGFKIRAELENMSTHADSSDRSIPQGVTMMPEGPEIKFLHTIIRNKETNLDDFIFYTKRLMRLLLECSLSLMPHEEKVSSSTIFDGLRIMIVHVNPRARP